jgi:hypothetical protein
LEQDQLQQLLQLGGVAFEQEGGKLAYASSHIDSCRTSTWRGRGGLIVYQVKARGWGSTGT